MVDVWLLEQRLLVGQMQMLPLSCEFFSAVRGLAHQLGDFASLRVQAKR